jgi:hypothetical protein
MRPSSSRNRGHQSTSATTCLPGSRMVSICSKLSTAARPAILPPRPKSGFDEVTAIRPLNLLAAPALSSPPDEPGTTDLRFAEYLGGQPGRQVCDSHGRFSAIHVLSARTAEFHAKRSVISSESDQRFQGKAITDFTEKRSGISRQTDHCPVGVKSLIELE